MNRKERRRENKRLRNNQRHKVPSAPIPSDTNPTKEALSQYALTNKETIARIVDSLQDESPMGSCVVELGPGSGSITKLLVQRYPKMTAVDLNEQVVENLKHRIPSLDLRTQSLLDFDLEAHAAARGGRLTVAANLPPGIALAAVYRLMEATAGVRRAVLVMDKQAADRILATPDQRRYGPLAILTRLFGGAKALFPVPSLAFESAPMTLKSTVVQLDFPPQPPLAGRAALILRRLLQAAYEMKTEELRVSLPKSRPLREAIPALREACASDFNWLSRRPSELAPGKWLHIARSLDAFKPSAD